MTSAPDPEGSPVAPGAGGAEENAPGPSGDTVALPEPVVAPPAGSLQGLELRVIPDEVDVQLRPELATRRSGSLDMLWHRADPRPGALVTITSTDSRPRVVSLRVRGLDERWNGAWVRWVLVVRRLSETQGADAASAQDVLSENDTVLNLLVLPGEKRSATLEFGPVLDADTYPGNYQFEVVATDFEDGSADTATGLLRLRHPFARLLQYLPAIYRDAPDDPPGPDAYADRSFFHRYLLGYQDALAPMEETLAGVHLYMGANTAPPDFLPWLASWVALVLDENWPQLKRRRLIREAAELYRLRGSRLGLARFLEIYAGVVPEINDTPFEGMRLGPQTLLGRDSVLGDVPPHTFVVTLAVPTGQTVNEQIVRDIIDTQKPAHTAYRLRIVAREDGEPERS